MMDIAFGADETYAPYIPATIESILRHHPDDPAIRFWIMTTEAGAALIQPHLTRRADIRILDAGTDFRQLPMSDDPRLEQISSGMYLKLMLPDAMPKGVNRLLYLDVDVLCNTNLTELWETDLGSAVLAAVVDKGAPTVSSFDGLPGAPATMRPGDPYFNAGVLLIDIPEWSRLRITDRCFHYVASLAEPYRFPDQDALNVATHGHWVPLDATWNHMVNFDLGNVAGYRNARIIHFAGPPKPWHANYPVAELRARYESLSQECRVGR